jgi:hypothetical protein
MGPALIESEAGVTESPKSEGVELEVRMKMDAICGSRQGDPSRPLSRNTLVTKFMEQLNSSNS